MRQSVIAALLAFALFCGKAQAGEAAGSEPGLKLPSVFGNNMVLQQGMPLPVWGWAAPGEEITVRIAGQAKTATADEKGKWTVTLDPLSPGEPVEMEVAGKSKITFGNVLVGEVWVCSGQSNMDFRLESALNAEAEKAAANHPGIRFFVVPNVAAVEPQEHVEARWAVCTPESARWFSAVGYFFGRRLHAELKVPVGLVHTAWGGTPAESWISREGLAAKPDLAVFLERFKTSMDKYPEEKRKYDERLKAFEEEKKKAIADGDEEKGWETAALDDGGWGAMTLPQHWEKANVDVDGVVWFRKTVPLPADWKGKPLTLSLGPVDDEDVTYVNGEKVGETRGYNLPRNYPVDPRLTETGALAIAVRVTDSGGPGGLYGDAAAMRLVPPEGDPVGIAGEWKYKIAISKSLTPKPPIGPNNPWLPMSLYNAKIAPLVPYGIRGAIWYQGESNAGRAYQYRTLFPAMIEDWRSHWRQGDFPFLFVQLANFQAPLQKPGESAWAELREAQTMTLSLPNAGMAVSIDIGDAADIHPKNKQDVGWRLAQWALGATYGKAVVISGPLYKGMKVVGSTVVCEFEHVGGGLVARAGDLKQFAIAGQDRVFVWADAKIEGNTVVVSSAEVAEPTAVRYAWANNPEGCNLYNQEGLPASPFRTDDWPGTTDNNQ